MHNVYVYVCPYFRLEVLTMDMASNSLDHTETVRQLALQNDTLTKTFKVSLLCLTYHMLVLATRWPET